MFTGAKFFVKELPPTLDGKFDSRPVSGQMSDYISRQFGVDELDDPDKYYSDKEKSMLTRVRAFEIRSLIGQSLIINSNTHLNETLERFLREKLPRISWVVDSDLLGPLAKYFIIHCSIPAPEDTTTMQGMNLEVFGDATQIGDMGRDSKEWDDWYWNLYRIKFYQPFLDGEINSPVPNEPVVIQIRSATYSNLQYTGVNIPFYM